MKRFVFIFILGYFFSFGKLFIIDLPKDCKQSLGDNSVLCPVQNEAVRRIKDPLRLDSVFKEIYREKENVKSAVEEVINPPHFKENLTAIEPQYSSPLQQGDVWKLLVVKSEANPEFPRRFFFQYERPLEEINLVAAENRRRSSGGDLLMVKLTPELARVVKDKISPKTPSDSSDRWVLLTPWINDDASQSEFERMVRESDLLKAVFILNPRIKDLNVEGALLNVKRVSPGGVAKLFATFDPSSDMIFRNPVLSDASNIEYFTKELAHFFYAGFNAEQKSKITETINTYHREVIDIQPVPSQAEKIEEAFTDLFAAIIYAAKDYDKYLKSVFFGEFGLPKAVDAALIDALEIIPVKIHPNNFGFDLKPENPLPREYFDRLNQYLKNLFP